MATVSSGAKRTDEISPNPVFADALLPVERAQAVVWLMGEVLHGGIGSICNMEGKAGRERREWLLGVCRDDLERTLAEAESSLRKAARPIRPPTTVTELHRGRT